MTNLSSLLVTTMLLVGQGTVGHAKVASAYVKYWGEESSNTETKHKLYESCQMNSRDTDNGCAQSLSCTDYTPLDKAIGSRCECDIPTDPIACVCETEAGIYRRWTWTNHENDKKFNFSTKAPKAGWKRAGCYLENGEICHLSHHNDPNADTHFLCKISYFCSPLKEDYGFCRFGTASLPPSASFLVILLIAILPSFFSSFCHHHHHHHRLG